jgi:prevent-host-death family protein
VNMLEAKSNLSRLVEAIEQGKEREIAIARNGRPAARLVPIAEQPPERRIGVAKGACDVPDNIDARNEEVARLFLQCHGS